MKTMLFAVLAFTSFSSFAVTSIECVGGTIKVLENFSYSADKVLLQEEILLLDNEPVFIVANKEKMEAITIPAELQHEKGSSVFILTTSTDENDAPVEGLNLFNAVIEKDLITDLKADLKVKSANQYPGTDFTLMDIEAGLFLSCIKK